MRVGGGRRLTTAAGGLAVVWSGAVEWAEGIVGFCCVVAQAWAFPIRSGLSV